MKEHRAEVPRSWICLGERDVAVVGLGAWDVWPHAGWARSDTADQAGWMASVNERTLWLTVKSGDPPELHLSDGGSSLLSVALFLGDDQHETGRVEVRHDELPPIATVCAAARACFDAIPRSPPPASSIDEDSNEPDPVEGAMTLRDCYNAWRREVAALETTGAPTSPACGTESAPPFASLDGALSTNFGSRFRLFPPPQPTSVR